MDRLDYPCTRVSAACAVAFCDNVTGSCRFRRFWSKALHSYPASNFPQMMQEAVWMANCPRQLLCFLVLETVVLVERRIDIQVGELPLTVENGY